MGRERKQNPGSRTSSPTWDVLLKDFDLMLNEAQARAPVGELVDIDDVGSTCAYLATPYARRVTGETLYVDGGAHIMG
jgi:enoyl-[acyl-carrier protein] reductase I